jgi:hypothetical protein
MTLQRWQAPTESEIPKPSTNSDLVFLEKYITDKHGEAENLAEVAKLTALVAFQSTVTSLLGFGGFLPTVGITVPILFPLSQSLTQIDNSCGIAVNDPKRFVHGAFGTVITGSNALYGVWQGYHIQGLKSAAIQEIKQGEALVKGSKPPSNSFPTTVVIAIAALLFMFKQIKDKGK